MELAPRSTRLGAVLIDAAILVVPNVLVGIDAVPEAVRLVVAAAALAIVVWQIVWLTRYGQTIGKKALGIRIVRKDTLENGGFVTNVLMRGLLNALLSLIPLYFLVDSLFIFREDRRCVHDMIAGTCVMRNPE